MIRRSVSRPVGALVALAAGSALASIAGLVAADALDAARLERDAKADFASQLSQAVPHSPAASRSGPVDPRDPFVTAETETLAAAQVDALIRATVLHANGTVLSSRAEARHDDGDPTHRIDVEVDIEGRIEAIQRALFGLETGAPFLFVDALSMQPSDGFDDKRPAGGVPVLHATLTLNAFWKGVP